ncbi:MAG: hypothetical protein R2856_08105 [Caldilineaceae bacterium]
MSNYSPAGDSPSGAADMAGNVAGVTASPAGLQETPDAYIVKGGSFLQVAAANSSSSRHSKLLRPSPTPPG